MSVFLCFGVARQLVLGGFQSDFQGGFRVKSSDTKAFMSMETMETGKCEERYGVKKYYSLV